MRGICNIVEHLALKVNSAIKVLFVLKCQLRTNSKTGQLYRPAEQTSKTDWLDGPSLTFLKIDFFSVCTLNE